MQFTYDSYKRLKQTKLFLCNPQGEELGWLSGIKELKLKIYFNSVSEISFKIYEYSDGIRYEFYDKLETLRLINMQYIAMFQIQTVEETHGNDIPISYKEITCKTLENELINKYVDNINGVFSLYNPDDQEHSLIHIIQQKCTWTLNHIDNSLLNKWRTFSIDSEKIYNLLTGNISKSFSCIFQFDTFNKQINIYELSNIGILTNIVISNKNILNQYIKKSDLDKISTKMRIRGGTNSDGTTFDLRAINPDGSTEIVNVDYYKTTEWMSQSLIDVLNSYKTAYENYSTQYSSALDTYKQYQSELTILQTQLIDIESQITAQEQVAGSSTKLHNGYPPIATDNDYTSYQNVISQIVILNTQKVSKQNEINTKYSQISSIQITLDNISANLDKSNYFTTEQLKELDSFLTQGSDYSDETFQITDTMTSSEIIQMKLELKSNAEMELLKVCRPQYTIETTLDNLWTIKDDKDSKISYSELRQDCVVGNFITLKFRNDYSIQVRLMIMEFDFDNLESVSLTFSDKNRLDDELTQLGEILSQAESTSKALNVNLYGFDKASKSTSGLLEFKNGILNASLNRMQNDEKGEVYFDEFGFRAKQIATDGSVGGHQMWLNPWRMLFTDDAFASANSAFGLLTLPDGTQRMGINTDLIFGNQVLTSNFTLSNENNTITLNKDGATFQNCDITINKGTNSIRLNASDGIQIFNGISKQFYIDIDGNVSSAGKITGGSMNINNKFLVDSSGKLTATGGDFQEGNITGGTIKGSKYVSLWGENFEAIVIDSGNMFFNGGGNPGIYYDNSTLNNIISLSPYNYIYGTIINFTNNILVGDENKSLVLTGSSVYSCGDLHVLGNIYGNINTNQLTASLTDYGNIIFNGANATSVTYVQTYFARQSALDDLEARVTALENA